MPLTKDTVWFVVPYLLSTTDVCSRVRTQAQPYLLASVNIVYSLVVSGYFNIGAEIMKSFIISKERSHLVHQSYSTLCPVSFAKGLKISAKCSTNFL